MVEFCGKLHTYACSTDNSADFTVIADEHGTFMPGSRISCEGVLPHFAKKTPLVIFGDQDPSGIFRMDHFCFDTSSGHLADFLHETKTLPAGLCRKVTGKFQGEFLWKLDQRSESVLTENDMMAAEQAGNVIALFASSAAICRLWKSLLQMGLSCMQIDALYEKYGLQAQMQIRKAPYLCASFARLDLEQGDRLAVLADAYNRHTFPDYTKHCQARMDFVTRLAASLIEQSGDCYVLLSGLENALSRCSSPGLLGLMDPGLLLASALSSSFFHPVIEDGELRIYLDTYYRKEQEAVIQLRRLCETEQNPVPADPDDLKKYDDDQKKAICGCLGASCVAAITGGPGTGKTTVLKAVVSAVTNNGMSVSLCAPTGRAAARLSESTKNPASTIHRMLGIRSIAGREPAAIYNLQNPIPSDVIIVDESSMISLDLFCSLLCAVKDGGRLILVGDPDQLPSVSPGRVLEDIMKSGIVPVYRLQTIHRQAGGSSIVNNAYRILQSEKGNIPALITDRQFEIEYVADADEAVSSAVRIFTDEYDIRDPYKLQILTASRKGSAGKDQINQSIIDSLPGRLCPRKGLAKYDKIMTIHNSYDEESSYMNGDIGIISEITDDGVFLAGAARKHTFIRNFRDIDYAYASTTHKAQGSEYDHVVIVLDTEYPGMLYKGLLYTAVTRARKKVTVICVGNALDLAMSTESPERKSGLIDKLEEALHPDAGLSV